MFFFLLAPIVSLYQQQQSPKAEDRVWFGWRTNWQLRAQDLSVAAAPYYARRASHARNAPRTLRHQPLTHTSGASRAPRDQRHFRPGSGRGELAIGRGYGPAAWGTHRRCGVLTAGAGLPTPGTSPLTQRHKWTARIQVMAGVLTAWDAAIGVGRGTDDCRGPSRS